MVDSAVNNNKNITKKYCRLRTQDDHSENLNVYGHKILNNELRSSKASTRSYASNERPRSRQSSKTRTIRILANQQPKNINGVPTSMLTNLFNAKCKDLQLVPKDGQLKRFYDFCSKAIQGRKYAFREIGLGYHSAKVLGSILRLNKCSHLDLRKNVLGNKGLKELSKALNTNSSLVHIDIGSNDITYEGANSFFLSLRKHSTITSLNIANSDGLHRNRIGTKGCTGINSLLKANT